MIQPPHERFDAAAVIRAGLLAVLGEGHRVELVRNADYTPDRVVSVVQTPVVRALGEVTNRWAFSVTVTIHTTGPDYDAAADEADLVADALLSITEADGVLFSSVICDTEPAAVSAHSPTGATALASTFSLIMRRKDKTNAF